MRGTLMRILEALPSTMAFEDGNKTWSVPSLIGALRDGTHRAADDQAYVLYSCKDGRRAIVRVEASGGLAKTASYLQVA